MRKFREDADELATVKAFAADYGLEQHLKLMATEVESES